jgi:two-component system, OmpR family, phosphate regulon sensor histidine kinase PhoR
MRFHRPFVLLVAAAALLLVWMTMGGTALAIVSAAVVGAVAALQIRPQPPLPVVTDADDPRSMLQPGVEAAMTVLDQPALLVRDNRVLRANPAARALLGEHVEGEDVRLAIRHPQARLALDEPDRGGIELADFGAAGRRFVLSADALPDGSRLVTLADRSLDQAAERMRTDFVANASHELRTPLATLLGFIETLEDVSAGGDKATRTRFLGIMAGEARRMQRLVDDLISLSRIEADRFTAPSSKVALGQLVAEVAASVSDAQHLPADRLLVSVDPHLAVTGDRAQLSQLLHNLVGNALKYGRGGTPVQISVAPAGHQVRLQVADEGEGIAAEHLPRLTERFYRADPGRSRSLGGTGLGLSIVKHIAERHRARLQIESQIGRGTTVTVTFPAAQAS